MANVGIVIISHSEKVANGVKDILEQAVGQVTVEAAGGQGDGEIGTSLEKIQGAIEKVHSAQGTIVFYDLGSAKMNAEIAIEMLELENVQLAEAPVLEGAYLAAVESSMGRPLEKIVNALEKEFK
ncbi:dihydroxyacetone kinase, phosphotransfer subunit [Thalassobacillus cyri]|uniref:phosphoenolpyruvate--glycerone phosphotransferase n=1 Tax=Thalassobacillus cyri TaxID=571932 RepID=A0A1H4A7S7_9BACI|nr:dihydroxyacetone kinase phosphoryl donor subunit DhaM [Thalassobacillus cyri]SEA31997.1 dihydroxyacetone kinase, phosphotransfer subunit [Thalassobacillus cyri]